MRGGGGIEYHARTPQKSWWWQETASLAVVALATAVFEFCARARTHTHARELGENAKAADHGLVVRGKQGGRGQGQHRPSTQGERRRYNNGGQAPLQPSDPCPKPSNSAACECMDPCEQESKT